MKTKYCPDPDCGGDLIKMLDNEWMCDDCRRIFEFDDHAQDLRDAWLEGWHAGWINRHSAVPDKDGNVGAQLPIINPYALKSAETGDAIIDDLPEEDLPAVIARLQTEKADAAATALEDAASYAERWAYDNEAGGYAKSVYSVVRELRARAVLFRDTTNERDGA